MSRSADDETAALLARVGSRVRAARTAARMSQAELAAKIGVVRSSVANIEQGRQGLTMMRLGQLAAALGVTVDALIVAAEIRLPETPQAHKVGVIRVWMAGCTTCGTELGWDVHREKVVQMKNDHIADTLTPGGL